MKYSDFSPMSVISSNHERIYTATVVVKKLFRKPVKRRIARFEDSEWAFVDGNDRLDIDAVRRAELEYLLNQHEK